MSKTGSSPVIRFSQGGCKEQRKDRVGGRKEVKNVCCKVKNGPCDGKNEKRDKVGGGKLVCKSGFSEHQRPLGGRNGSVGREMDKKLFKKMGRTGVVRDVANVQLCSG